MIPLEKLLVATIAGDAEDLAREYGIGLEIDEFCTAANMDGDAFAHWDAVARQKMGLTNHHILHAPYAELSPAAIDPKIREVVRARMEQAYQLAAGYGIDRMVVHGGYIPEVYFPEWYVEQSAAFWRAFLADKPDTFTLLIENVLEDKPSLMADLMQAIDDARARICLDIGHAHVKSAVPVDVWIDTLAPYIGHVHLHNNFGEQDTHGGIQEGSMPVKALVQSLLRKAPDATYTLEIRSARTSLAALLDSPIPATETDDPPRALLKRVFGYDDFREGQRALIDAQLGGQDALGVMPTGSGKSICFQLPALLLSGITLVISPLVSLMKDQVSALRQAGVAAAYLNSSLTERQFDAALRNAYDGQYRIIYIAPERLLTARFLSFAREVDIALIAVDEAHCISQWGQDFRPSYLDVPRFLTAIGKRPPLSAFTATATPRVKDDIVRMLGLDDPVRVQTGFDRPNLFYKVMRPKQKKLALLEMMESYRSQSGIIYCATRKNVEEVCALLREQGYAVTRYHAGLGDEERRQNQEDFTFDRCPVIVATNAFGMGIDKSNVRFIIHYNMPKDIESYYQEAGRAGRDGEPANCVLLYSGQDVSTQRYLIELDENEDMDPVLRAQVRKNALDRLQNMLLYCRTQKCLRAYILQYFGEQTAASCGHCGNCEAKEAPTDVTDIATAILACVRDTGERFGLGTIVEVLRGANTQRLRQFRLTQQESYGQLADVSTNTIKLVGEQLLAEEYLRTSERSQYPLVTLGPRGEAVLEDNEQVWLVLPKVTTHAQPAAPASAASAPAGPVDMALFEALRSLRLRLATTMGVPAYVILGDATLREMSVHKPRNRAQLLGIKGIGEAKAKQYGAAFLKVIDDYLQDA